MCRDRPTSQSPQARSTPNGISMFELLPFRHWLERHRHTMATICATTATTVHALPLPSSQGISRIGQQNAQWQPLIPRSQHQTSTGQVMTGAEGCLQVSTEPAPLKIHPRCTPPSPARLPYHRCRGKEPALKGGPESHVRMRRPRLCSPRRRRWAGSPRPSPPPAPVLSAQADVNRGRRWRGSVRRCALRAGGGEPL